MFKRKKNYGYTIAYCDAQDIKTKFGSWGNVFDTYKHADFVIRMLWPQATRILEGQYKLGDEWLIVEKVEKKRKDGFIL